VFGFFFNHFSHVLFCIVLHPQLKLKYFQQNRWEKDWIETAEEIVREEFTKYDILDVTLPSVSHFFFLFNLVMNSCYFFRIHHHL
jgi:hypothetical protein